MNSPCNRIGCLTHDTKYIGNCGKYTVRRLTECAIYKPTEATESPAPSGQAGLVGYATQLDNHDCAAWASKLLNSCQCDDGWKSAEKVATALLYAFKLGKEAK